MDVIQNNNLNKVRMGNSSKNIVLKISPSTPNVINIKKTNLDTNTNISLNINEETSDKYIQTEEIFFKSKLEAFYRDVYNSNI